MLMLIKCLFKSDCLKRNTQRPASMQDETKDCVKGRSIFYFKSFVFTTNSFSSSVCSTDKLHNTIIMN